MKKKWIVLGMVVLLISYVALPKDIEAKTIQQFEEEVERYTRELEEKQANLVRNDEEIAAITKKIHGIEAQIKEAEDEIERLQEEIEKSEEEIKKKSEESKSIISYYQIANGENAYLEYAFGATDITDMIYRLSVVEQLTEYNDKIMKELEELIRQNQIKQAELVKKEEELNKFNHTIGALTIHNGILIFLFYTEVKESWP